MNDIKNVFSIYDFENLTGIKAHTIRIWEKRYELFNPDRHKNNERLYDIEDLKKILNISFLYNNGWKISKISKLDQKSLNEKVRELVVNREKENEAINILKLSMMTFDVDKFNAIYTQLISSKSFREIFQDIFLPFLDMVGILWQTDTITPAHEHFISQLIENKLQTQIDKLQIHQQNSDRTFVLFLPDGEIHSLGILYIQYELLLKGFRTIFLGHSIPLSDLEKIKEFFQPITFITQFIIAPSSTELQDYIKDLNVKLLNDNHTECWVNSMKYHKDISKANNAQLKSFSNVKDLLISI